MTGANPTKNSIEISCRNGRFDGCAVTLHSYENRRINDKYRLEAIFNTFSY